MRSLRPLLLAVFVTAPVPAAVAQETSVSVTAADALFEEGRSALQAGNLEVACARFRESNRLDPAVGTVLNLADCEEKRGKLATAWTLFRHATAELDASDDRLTVVRQRLAELETRVPRLVLEPAAGAGPETRARLAGTDLGSGSFGVPLPLDPGHYEVVVSSPGKDDRVFSVTLVEGQVERLEIAAGADRESESIPRAMGGAGEARRTWTYVIGGGGVIGLGVGVVSGLLTLRQRGIADANCSDQLRLCNAAGQEANDTGRTLGAISTIGFVVGAVGVGAAAYLLLTEPEESQAATLRATIGANNAGLSFEKRF